MSLSTRACLTVPLFGALVALVLTTASCSGNDAVDIGSSRAPGATTNPGGPTGTPGPGEAPAVSGPDAPPGSPPGSPPSAPCTATSQDPTHASLCVSLRPEAIDLSTDPSFDGKGTLWIAAYQSPLATPASLLKEIYVGSAAAPVAVKSLPQTVRLDGVPPGTVYVRAVLFDGAVAPAETPSAGWWVGGYDITGGVDSAKLVPVQTKAGQPTKLDLDLLLLRKLTVNVHRSPGVLPLGDGRGPLRAVALPTSSMDTQKAITFFGQAASTCGDLSGAANASLAGYVVGKGPYWIFAVLDDFGVGGIGPDGSLISIAGTTPTAILLPPENAINYAPGAPIIATTVALDTAVPRQTPAPDVVTCH